MSLPPINLLLVILCAFFSLGLGFFWMTILFAKPYGKYMYGVPTLGADSGLVSKKQKIFSFGFYILFAHFTAYVFALGLKILSPSTLTGAMAYALLVWMGFFMPFTLNKVVWQMKSWVVFFIDASYELTRLLLMVLILWYWP